MMLFYVSALFRPGKIRFALGVAITFVLLKEFLELLVPVMEREVGDGAHDGFSDGKSCFFIFTSNNSSLNPLVLVQTNDQCRMTSCINLRSVSLNNSTKAYLHFTITRFMINYCSVLAVIFFHGWSELAAFKYTKKTERQLHTLI